MPSIISFIGYDPDRSQDTLLASTLINYRREKGLSRKKLAMEIGVDESTVFMWEQGRQTRFRKVKERFKAFLKKKKNYLLEKSTLQSSELSYFIFTVQEYENLN